MAMLADFDEDEHAAQLGQAEGGAADSNFPRLFISPRVRTEKAHTFYRTRSRQECAQKAVVLIDRQISVVDGP
ncbi:hypothetical protein LG047_12055 [Methylocystis sp. WRRC1]|uniref:hypothetical protein n=1 Tax=Methylocystis sp. WRRC1 TaxID=1732014 RepID=UPI001D1460CD|nr:hypothetical protein [Methylocystis sp. WRRC1]MCC3246049.1 hypothetical protein [Methylocystis sp. WRRC1]